MSDAVRWVKVLPDGLMNLRLCFAASCHSALCPLRSPEHIKHYKHLTLLRSRKEVAQTCLKSIALGARMHLSE